MNRYPADERQICEVERGRCCETVVTLPPGETFSAGEDLLFALAQSRPGEEPHYIKGGDSVRVLLTRVTDLEEVDVLTGQPRFQIAWKPLGLVQAPDLLSTPL